MLNNLANTYRALGRLDEVLRVRQEVYSGRLALFGKEHGQTMTAASNYAMSLLEQNRRKEAKALLRKTLPVVRRVLGDTHEIAFRTRGIYALALYQDPAATLDDLHEAVDTLEDTERISRRVFGGAHPTTKGLGITLRDAQTALRARETPSSR